MATRTHKINPFIPKPLHKEQPVTEVLAHEPPLHPHLVQAIKHDIPVMVPNYNELYDSMRTKHAWKYLADQYAQGTVTTVAGTAVLVTVSLTLPANTQSPNWRLEQWPGGTLLFLVVRQFNFGPQTAVIGTQGEITTLFIDQFGNTAPMGILPNNNFVNIGFDTIMPGAITDSGDQVNLGQLSFTLNTGATVGTYAWQLGFSAAYLLPALKGYEMKYISDQHMNHTGLHR